MKHQHELELAKLQLEEKKLSLERDKQRESVRFPHAIDTPNPDVVHVKSSGRLSFEDDVLVNEYTPFVTDGFVSLSATGDSVLVRGIGSTQLNVPLHWVNLESDLVRGAVVVGVLPVLPVEGVDVILGNDLAGELVWGDASVVVTPKPTSSGELDDLAK
ncbi:hypothetical protein SKAU_G00137190 [Synaphobranchus kaupii]|uniref:Uncharacterized protein n=1 Tax=Synaphobranchus kaupii TaxID=118154 RepID=A0A9Q1FRR7_SYNKA|nr:hypothetical protein SKAU_G00137190 [Synaphobranchus kaupii]